MARRADRLKLAILAGAITSVAVAASFAGRIEPNVDPAATATASDAARPPLAPWSAVTLHVAGKDPGDAGGNAFLNDAVAWDGGIVAVGYEMDGGRPFGHVWRSATGDDWADVAADGRPFDDIALQGVSAWGGSLLAVGEDRSPVAAPDPNGAGVPAVWISADGRRWQRLPADATPWLETFPHEPVAGPERRAIALGSEHLWLTDDGSSWLSVPFADVMPDTRVWGAVWARDRWLAGGVEGQVDLLGGNQAAKAAIWWSFDARTWHKAAINADGLATTQFFVGARGIVTFGHRVGHGPLVLETPMWASVDGATWQQVRFPNRLASIVTDGQRLVAIDSTELEVLRVRESFDGFAWSDVEVLGQGLQDPDDPVRLAGAMLPLQPIAPVLLGDRLWVTTSEQAPGGGFDQTRVRWVATAGVAPAARPLLPGRRADADDASCGETPCG